MDRDMPYLHETHRFSVRRLTGLGRASPQGVLDSVSLRLSRHPPLELCYGEARDIRY